METETEKQMNTGVEENRTRVQGETRLKTKAKPLKRDTVGLFFNGWHERWHSIAPAMVKLNFQYDMYYFHPLVPQIFEGYFTEHLSLVSSPHCPVGFLVLALYPLFAPPPPPPDFRPK